MNGLKYCFDATALVIYLIEEEPSGDIDKIMEDIESERSRGFLSVVNLAEFHRAITRIFSEQEADKYVTWLKESKLEIVSPDVEVACMASIKKLKYASARDPFAWGNAFCLATAEVHEADYIITSDSEFQKVNEIPIVWV